MDQFYVNSIMTMAFNRRGDVLLFQTETGYDVLPQCFLVMAVPIKR